MFEMSLAREKVKNLVGGFAKSVGLTSWAPLIDLQGEFSSVLEKMPNKGLDFVIGETAPGFYHYEQLERMPHLLVAGTTGSGKSVFINSLVACLIARHTPDDLQFIMVDPKEVEFAMYESLPHVREGVVSDIEEALPLVEWAVHEMQNRLSLMKKNKVRDLESYNKVASRPLPRLVIIIDEFADLILGSSDKKLANAFDVALTRLAQKARAAGIHLILATQKPIVKVVTPLLKGNVPARVALRVANSSDSRVIIDQGGAEKLNGRGDMLFQSPYSNGLKRIQGVWIPDAELEELIKGA